MAEDFTSVDFFRDGRLTGSVPVLRSPARQVSGRREAHYGVTMVTGWQEAVDVYNDADVLVLHLGDRPVPRLPGAIRRRRHHRPDRGASRRYSRSTINCRHSTRPRTPITAHC